MPVIADLQLTITPATGLYANTVSDGIIAVGERTDQGRNQIVLDFNSGNGVYARDLGTIFQWPCRAGTVLRRWQPSLVPMPETIFGRSSDWDFAGGQGAKFIQGYMVRADSFGVAKTFQIQSQDDRSLNPVNETPVVFNQERMVAVSAVTPFISHATRLTSSDGVRWRIWEASPVFQPYPEAALAWNTEMMAFTKGWQHVRLLIIPYIALGAVTLTLIFDQQANMVISGQMPSTTSQLYPTKTKVIPSANKSKLVGFQATSAQGFRIFKESIEVWVGEWGRTGPYEIVKPFGGASAAGAEL